MMGGRRGSEGKPGAGPILPDAAALCPSTSRLFPRMPHTRWQSDLVDMCVSALAASPTEACQGSLLLSG